MSSYLFQVQKALYSVKENLCLIYIYIYILNLLCDKI